VRYSPSVKALFFVALLVAAAFGWRRVVTWAPSGGMGTRSRNSALAEALWEAFLHFVLFSGKHR